MPVAAKVTAFHGRTRLLGRKFLVRCPHFITFAVAKTSGAPRSRIPDTNGQLNRNDKATTMDIETARAYCLSLPKATEDFPFDETTLVFRIMGKIFAAIDLDRPGLLVLKCNPERAVMLRERHEEIEGAWHWNKKYWNQLRLDGRLDEQLLRELIDHSYSEVVRKLPRKVRAEHPEIGL